MTLARDIGIGPNKPFGGALNRQQREPIPLITERPRRPDIAGFGRCKHCGSRYFGCCEKDLEDSE
jgi:hypothetical protein